MAIKVEMLELTVAAQRARLSPKQTLRLVTLGEIAGVKSDGRWLVSADDVDAWRKAHPAAPVENKAVP
jgi:hypothetical protein